MARTLLPLGLALLASAPGLAHATIMLPVSLEEMTKEAAAVVRGRVVDRVSSWDEARQKIYTVTTLDVIDTIVSHSSLPRQIRVRTLGGEVDGIGMKVSGSPQFGVGEDVLLFLRNDPVASGEYQVIGMSQGLYRIRQQPKGQIMAVPSPEGIAFVKPGVDGVLRVDPNAAAPKETPLVDLRKRILEIAHSASLAPTPAPAVQTSAAPAATTR